MDIFSYCTSCGKQLIPEDKFCVYCGKQQPDSGLNEVSVEELSGHEESLIGKAALELSPWIIAAAVIGIILLFLTGVGIPFSVIGAIALFNYVRKICQGKED
ncbi:MAG: zinc ribbon domain-containing protein [Terriglobia bacterium]